MTVTVTTIIITIIVVIISCLSVICCCVVWKHADTNELQRIIVFVGKQLVGSPVCVLVFCTLQIRLELEHALHDATTPLGT